MNDAYVSPVTELLRTLKSAYGGFLEPKDVADVFDVSLESLRSTIRRSKEPNVVYLRRHKLRFGRRVRFPAQAVAEALLLDAVEIESRLKKSNEGVAENG